MTSLSENQKKLTLSNAVVRKFKLPKIFKDNQLFASVVYNLYQTYRYSKYYFYNLAHSSPTKETKLLNFKPYEIEESQFRGFDHDASIKLSIIVPAYNVEKYIIQCLDSIINAVQGFDNYEIIVVEDCSKDNTLKLLKEISSTYNNLKLLINETNLGLSASRNKGLKASLGNYITFVDSDDMLSFGILSEAMKVINIKDCDIVEFDFESFSDELDIKEFLAPRNFPVINDIVLTNSIDIHAISKGFACGKIYKRELFKSIRFPEGLYWEDAIISNIILWQAKVYIHLDIIGYLYRMNPNSISRAAVTRNLGYDQFYVIKYCLEVAKNPDLDFNLDINFYKRLFVEATICLNNRTSYLGDGDLLYMLNELEEIFMSVNMEPYLNSRQNLMLKAIHNKNVAAWRAISF
jgi:glycosyltransferase involved in cell wall biosynthesis